MLRRLRWSESVPLFSAIACLTISLWWGKRLQFQPFDDAYITLRAAANWAAGYGPVFNPGERVESATSPLWTALLAAGIRAGASPEALLPVLGAVFAAAAAAISSALALESGGILAGVVAGTAIAALPTWSGWTFSGMEVPLAGLLIALAAWAASHGRPLRAGLLCALSALSRPEALVLAPVLAAFASGPTAEKRVRPLLVFALACALPLGIVFLARHAWFGAWLPNTYVAKRGGLGGGAALVRGTMYVAAFFLLHPALALGIGWAAASPRRTERCIAVTCIVFLAALAWEGGDHFGNFRLVTPALPLACAAAASLAAHFRWRAIATAVVIATVALPAITGFRIGDGSLQPSLPGTKFIRDEAVFTRNAREAGEALATLPPGTVATVAIGAIGYFSRRPILDLVGLADERIARSPHLRGAAAGHDHADVDYVLWRQPEIALLVPELTREPRSGEQEEQWLFRERGYFLSALLLLRDPRFQASYFPVDVRAADGRYLRVWARTAWMDQELVDEVSRSR